LLIVDLWNRFALSIVQDGESLPIIFFAAKYTNFTTLNKERRASILSIGSAAR
jgi:hypothetical protein